MRDHRLHQLAAHRHERVEARQWILKDCADMTPAQPPHRLRVEIVDAPAGEPDLAARMPQWRFEQPDNCAAGNGLARAGLAHDTQHLPLRDVERGIVHGEQRAAAGRDLNPQVAHREERLTHC